MKYEKIKYPDGQISVHLTDLTFPYEIKERINSYEDLFLIKSICEALDFHHIKNRHLIIPCLFGQRSDSRFESSRSFDLKTITDFINSCGFVDVEILDPHSNVSLSLITNSKIRSSFEFVKSTLEDINKECILVAPDAGAYKKVWDYAKELNLPLVGAIKHRDLQGNIDLKFVGDVQGRVCLIVDDLADGGYTFTLLADQLKKQGASEIYLYVSHGYFSKGFDELKRNISHIYCTNSVKDIDDPFVTQFKVI